MLIHDSEQNSRVYLPLEGDIAVRDGHHQNLKLLRFGTECKKQGQDIIDALKC